MQPATHYTAMVVGPDGDLYAADDQGYIYRYVINPDGTLGREQDDHDGPAKQHRRGLTHIAKGARIIAGMAFDPNSSPKHPVLWITSGYPGGGLVAKLDRQDQQAQRHESERLSG